MIKPLEKVDDLVLLELTLRNKKEEHVGIFENGTAGVVEELLEFFFGGAA